MARLQVELHYPLEIAKALLLRETIEVAQHVQEEAASVRRSQTQVPDLERQAQRRASSRQGAACEKTRPHVSFHFV